MSISIRSPGRGGGWNLGHAQVDPGGFGPEAGVAEVGDSIRAPGDDAHQDGRAAIGEVNRVPADVGICEERADGGGEVAHQKLAFSRTRPIISLAPPATATTATPIRVFEVVVLVASLAVLSQ